MLNKLTTEQRNPASENIDSLDSRGIVRLMNAEDAKVAEAVGRETEALARAIDAIAERMRGGGRLIYTGAGTSGRLGVLDATECPPTFSTPPGLVVGLIAGGYKALTQAVEGAEDHPEYAEADLKAINLSAQDVVVGIATSGRTPYVIGSLKYGRRLGAFTVGLSCNDQSALSDECDLSITPVVGPEVVSGSTRLKAGTATKMVLNILTTGTMVRLGKTFGNLMVDLRATNSKLTLRARRIVSMLTELSEVQAEVQLQRCDGELKTAVVAQQRSLTPNEARHLLEQSNGHLRKALDVGTPPPKPAQRGAPTPVETPDRRSPRTTVAPLVLGVDGGGTKVLAWLAEANGDKLLGQGRAGPANPRSAGFERAMESLDEAIGAAFQNAGLPRQPVAAACLALAGAGRDSDRQQVERWATERQITERLQLVSDAEPLLAAGTTAGTGIALIAGTGSFAYGRDEQGRTERVGGWGYLFGDEGSGCAIAVAGLRAAAHAADGRGAETQLLHDFQTELRVETPMGLIEAIYRRDVDHAAIAQLAPVVVKAAADGDAVARQLIDESAHELAKMVATLCRQLEFNRSSLPLALAGSLLLRSESLKASLQACLADVHAITPTIGEVHEPVRGSLTLARKLM